jgi:hypothetical protein
MYRHVCANQHTHTNMTSTPKRRVPPPPNTYIQAQTCVNAHLRKLRRLFSYCNLIHACIHTVEVLNISKTHTYTYARGCTHKHTHDWAGSGSSGTAQSTSAGRKCIRPRKRHYLGKSTVCMYVYIRIYHLSSSVRICLYIYIYIYIYMRMIQHYLSKYVCYRCIFGARVPHFIHEKS